MRNNHQDVIEYRNRKVGGKSPQHYYTNHVTVQSQPSKCKHFTSFFEILLGSEQLPN